MKSCLFVCSIILIISACSVDENRRTAYELRYSEDSLFFDTVFTQMGSFSRRLTVYNDGPYDVVIPSISINTAGSFYKLIISGMEVNSYQNIELVSGDSLLILATVNIDPGLQNIPFVVEDSIEFNLKTSKDYVKLIAWGQNAHYLSDSILNCSETWIADKPYVIYNSILVDSLCTLTIEKGAQIYSHNNSAIFIKGSLITNGTSTDRILFSNDRFDGDYQNYTGQWEGIYFLEGSNNNILNYTDIRNSVVGLRIGTPDSDTNWDVQMNQVYISNILNYGILSFTSDVKMINSAVVQSGIRNMAIFAGGNYHIENCTFYNYEFMKVRTEPTFIFSDNVVLADNSLLTDNLQFSLWNSVVWGDIAEEIQMSNSNQTSFQWEIKNCLLKTSDVTFLTNNTINDNPLFQINGNYSFYPEPNSPVINAGFDNANAIDLTGKTRSIPPDIGAMEY